MIQRLSLLAAALWAASLSLPVIAAEYQATLGWAERRALSLPISGWVKEVSVRAGQIVPAGAALVSLDPGPFEARLSEARAAVQALERKRAEAEREVGRAKELYARTVLSTVELEKAYIDQQQVEGQYQQAKARLRQAELERNYTVLKSPFAARILRVHTAPGEAISANLQAPPLIEVARADVLEASAQLKPEEARSLKLGAQAEVEVGGRRLAGTIHAIESLQEGGYRLMVRVSTEDDWIAGLPAKIHTP